MSVWVGIDVGGTFTDVIVYTENGSRSFTAKVASTPEDPSEGFIQGLMKGLEESNSIPGDVVTLVHGSTVGTNAVLERAGARVGIITTAGFEDTLYIGRAKRTEMYNLMIDPETPYFLCPRSRVRGVAGRMSKDGQVVDKVDAVAVRNAVHDLVENEKIEALAVNLLFSFVSPAQEEEIAAIVKADYPDLYVSLSSSVDPRAREYERMVVTTMDAYLRPKMARYIGTLQKRLVDLGFSANLQIMESHGGIIDGQMIQERAVGTLLSGLAGGAIGTSAIGRAASRRQILAFDMGGTSTDVTLINGGKPLVSDDGKIGKHDIRVPMVDVHTIGAGGGSIALVDASGSLRVGPQSAGADPGPAAYSRGGMDATVTDANLVLGFLGANGLAGGALSLDRERAYRAVEENVAKPLGIRVDQAAWGIHRIAVSGMAAAARVVSVSRGHDARNFTLLASGGAGPLHACGVADDLGITEILIPPYPGVLSAYGLLAADAEAPQWKTVRADLSAAGMAHLREELLQAGEDVRDRLIQSGVNAEQIIIKYAVDARYVGQSHELAIPVGIQDTDDVLGQQIRRDFEIQHKTLYGQNDPHGKVEVTGLKVTATAAREVPQPQAPVAKDLERTGWEIYDGDTGAYVPATVIHRGVLSGLLEGPAVLLQDDSTTIVRPGWIASKDSSGSLFLRKINLT